jgi:hypothetical protein
MLSANDRNLWASNGRSRREATVADPDRERREWAGKRAFPSDTYMPGLRRPVGTFVESD